MSISPSPKRQRAPAVQQPSPVSPTGGSFAHTPTVKLLERSAERMSLRSQSSNYPPSSPQFAGFDYDPDSFAHYDYAQPAPSASVKSYPRQQSYRNQSSLTEHPSRDAYNNARQRHLAAPKPAPSVTRGPSTASGSTLHHAGSLFRDFDGTHYAAPPESAYGYVDNESIINNDTHPEELPFTEDRQQTPQNPAPAQHSRAPSEFDSLFDIILADQANSNNPSAKPANQQEQDRPASAAEIDILPSQHHKAHQVAPPPADGMVYYPAPVPMTLNRPRRLSQHPSSALAAQRRSNVLGSIAPKLKQSAVWIGPEKDPANPEEQQNDQSYVDEEKPVNNHQTGVNLKKLPPQLRASVFFEQPSVQQRVKIKHGSAVATLDSLLDASARAPRNATVDETLRKAMTDLEDQPKQSSKVEPMQPARKSRLSFLPLRNTSSDKLSQIRQRATSMLGFDHLTGTVLVEEHDEDERDNDGDSDSLDNERTPLAAGSTASSRRSSFSGDEDEEEEANQHDGSEGGKSNEDADVEQVDEKQYLGAPTTLLAELQLRKKELRSRNRTAATAFPNGMHSTLLELDAVAQIEKRNRQTQRTALAWEDPRSVAAARKELPDENVPLGMLFPNKNGLANHGRGGSDWDRPLGLLERRDMEDHEPLSKRRNRLKGIKTTKPVDIETLAAPYESNAEAEQSEHEGETLAQRTRRLKSAKALNDAVGDAAGEMASKDFAGELMSQLGVPEAPSNENKTAAAVSGEDETLGQRRRRLLAESKSRQSSAEASGQQTLVAATASKGNLANLLAANPIGGIRQMPGESGSSGLLRQSEQTRAERRDQIFQQNHLSSANLLGSPLIDPTSDADARRHTAAGLLGASQHEAQSRRQQIQDTNYRSANAGIEVPLVAQSSQTHMPGGLLAQSENERALKNQQISQRNQGDVGAAAGLMGEGRADARQTKPYMVGRYNDGSGGISPAPEVVSSSAFPHQQSQSNLFSQGFGSSGFGISPRHMSSSHQLQAVPQSAGPIVLNMQQTAPALTPTPTPALAISPQSPDILSSKQRENIDRWRQSVMH